MALPFTIQTESAVRGYLPPFKSSAGNFYAVVRATSGIEAGRAVDVFKASDPSVSWAVQDPGNNPVLGPSDKFNQITAVQEGDLLHIATRVTGGSYTYHTFNMADDTWGVVNELIETPTNLPTQFWISIAVRSDGDVVVVYNGDTDQVMGGKKERVDANVRDFGTGLWGGAIALDAAGDNHYGNPNVIKGPLTDDMHCLWQTTANTTDPPNSWMGIEARTLRPDDSLSTVDTDPADSGSALLGIANLVSYDDGGTQRIIANAAPDASGFNVNTFLGSEDGSDDIQLATTATESIGENVRINGELQVASLAEVSGVLHWLFSNAAQQDLYYITSTDDGASWTTPAEEINFVDVRFISANIYTRGGDTVLAYVYDDGGDQKYNEKVLIAGVTGVPPKNLSALQAVHRMGHY